MTFHRATFRMQFDEEKGTDALRRDHVPRFILTIWMRRSEPGGVFLAISFQRCR